jgi:hypothetical protein
VVDRGAEHRAFEPGQHVGHDHDHLVARRGGLVDRFLELGQPS